MAPMNNRLMRPRRRTPAGRTLYFLGSSAAWSTLGDWYNDPAGTVPAASLPGVHDSVVIAAFIDIPPAIAPTVANLETINSATMLIDITVTGAAVFRGNSVYAFATLTGNAVFNEQTRNDGTINGNAVFNDTASNCGTVNGTVTINGTPDPCP